MGAPQADGDRWLHRGGGQVIAQLYNTIVLLYAAVTNWASSYVPAADARKVARHALARVWQLGVVGYETEAGVWALVFEQAYAVLLGVKGLSDIGEQVGAALSFPVPNEEVNCDISRLYVILYMMAIHGELTLAERSYVSAVLIREDWEPIGNLTWRRASEWLTEVAPAVRRAFQATMDHDCDRDVACAAASVLREDEERKGMEWAKAYAATKGYEWQDL